MPKCMLDRFTPMLYTHTSLCILDAIYFIIKHTRVYIGRCLHKCYVHQSELIGLHIHQPYTHQRMYTERRYIRNSYTHQRLIDGMKVALAISLSNLVNNYVNTIKVNDQNCLFVNDIDNICMQEFNTNTISTVVISYMYISGCILFTCLVNEFIQASVHCCYTNMRKQTIRYILYRYTTSTVCFRWYFHRRI